MNIPLINEPLTDQPVDKKLLIIGYVWPEPNSSAAGTRMMQLISMFINAGWQITFSSPAKLGEHKTDLSQLGIPEQEIELNSETFDRFIETLQPNLVIFDRYMMEEQFGWRVEKYAPQAIRMLNTEDLHSLRACRQQSVKAYLKQHADINLSEIPLTKPSELFQKMSQTDLAKREIAAIFRCDITLMISKFEMQLLQQQFQIPKSQLCYLPLLYSEVNQATLPSYEERAHFVTIGNFRHEPNWDAVLWLKQSIWPQIRKKLPNAELHIYGAYPPPKATALHNPKQGFLVKGWAEDAFEVIRNAKVLLAPIRFGAGIKGKLAEAMLNGTPSVTTPIGSEAMLYPAQAEWPGSITTDSTSFATNAIELYQNQEQWKKAQRLGFENINRLFVLNEETQSLSTDLLSNISKLQQNLNQHRSNNFMGAMLNHHHHKSTQYMAQWIEAKNKI